MNLPHGALLKLGDVPDEQSLTRFRLVFNRLAVGGETQDGAIVDDDLHVALVVRDA